MSKTMNELCEEGLARVLAGTPPAEAAAALLAGSWARLTREDRLRLARLGLAKTIADELAWRRGQPPGLSPDEEAEWSARREWFQTAEAMLEQAGVDMVCDLPPEKIGELALAARRVWKKPTPAATA
jgi:hypothetical protein